MQVGGILVLCGLDGRDGDGLPWKKVQIKKHALPHRISRCYMLPICVLYLSCILALYGVNWGI